MKQKVRQGDFSCSHLYSTRADGVEKSDTYIYTLHLSLRPDVKRINHGILVKILYKRYLKSEHCEKWIQPIV